MNKYVGLMISVGVACVPAVVLADAPAPAAPAGPSLSDILVNTGVTAQGYLDSSYTYGFNKPNALVDREFDANGNSFEFNQAALNIGYQPTEGFGGFVNIIAGHDGKVISGAYGDGSGDFSLTQAFVQYATGPLTVIAGRFDTLTGNEVINDTLDTNISRSLLFVVAEPLVHTGVRASWKFNDMVTAYLGVNNSSGINLLGFPSAAAGVAVDSNKEKTVEAGALFTPIKPVALGLYDYYGLEGSASTSGASDAGVKYKTNALDFVGSYQIIDPLQVVLNLDYDYQGIRDFGTARTYGAAGYVNYVINPMFKTSVRVEYVKEKASGSGGGDFSTNLREITATVDYVASPSFDVLGEFRIDGANDSSGMGFFPNGSSPDGDPDFKKSQGDIAIKAIWKFGTPVPAS